MKTLLGSLMACAGFAFSATAFAVGTPAGTTINNTATATYDVPGGASGVTQSSTTQLLVLELISVDVTAQDTSSIETNAGDTNEILTYQVTNTGNGIESFTFDATNLSGDDFDMDNIRIYRDDNNDGVFDATDSIVLANDTTIELNANSSTPNVTLFVVVDTPATATTTGNTSDLQLEAISATTGAPTASAGTVLVGQGTGVTDAVVSNNPTDTASSGFIVGAPVAVATVDIEKTIINTLDPFGGDSNVPGAIVTYQIVASILGGDVNGLVITDSLPANLTYVANTVTLAIDANAAVNQTDADDTPTDETVVVGDDITITIGDATAGTVYTVTLQAEID